MKIQELISVNLSSLTDSKQRIYASMNTDNTVTVNIDIPKWLHGFYKQVELRMYDPISSKNFKINKQYLTFVPFNKHCICHFYYNDISIDCSDAYKDLWNINDNYSLNDINYHNTFISLLERSIENRLNKLKELYFKVNNRETCNEVDEIIKNILGDKISIKPKYPTDELKEIISKPYPPTGESFIDGANMSYNGLTHFIGKLNKKEFKENQTIGYQPKKLKLKRRGLFSSFKNTDNNDLIETLQQATKPKPETTLYTFTRDSDLDELIEKINSVIERIPPVNDLSEETYKIKSITKDMDRLISSYLEVNIEDRRNKKPELQKALESMLNAVLNYYKMINDMSVSELNVELKFIELKYK